MKTSSVSAADFAAKFGTDKIKQGPFEYFLTDIGVGIIKNTEFNSIETVTDGSIDPEDITGEDELVMMSLVCGDFREDNRVPPTLRPIEEYKYEEKSSKWGVRKVWVGFGAFLTVALAVYIYAFYGK